MRSRARIVGHPIHPMLIVFPLGLLASALVFDLVALGSGNRDWAVSAFYMMISGVVMGLVAAVFGFVDWLAIPRRTRAKAIGVWHAVGNVVVVTLFFIAWLLRYDNRAAAGGASLVLMVLGVGLALVTGWLGGELVDRLGIGVDDGANANAPSSLSHRPATQRG